MYFNRKFFYARTYFKKYPALSFEQNWFASYVFYYNDLTYNTMHYIYILSIRYNYDFVVLCMYLYKIKFKSSGHLSNTVSTSPHQYAINVSLF